MRAADKRNKKEIKKERKGGGGRRRGVGGGKRGKRNERMEKEKKSNYLSILFNTGLYAEVSIGFPRMLGARFRLCSPKLDCRRSRKGEYTFYA